MQRTHLKKTFNLSDCQVEAVLLVLALFAMFFVYSYNLNDPSFGLWPDEASIGFNAYCISLNLHDAYNNFLPLYFKYQDGMIFRPPVFIYLTAIIIKLFGFSLYTSKILGIICALFASLFTYLICRKIFNIYVAIISFAFLLLSPGFFHIHRFAYELTTFGCFASGFIFFLIKSFENKSLKWGLLSFVFFVLAWFSYMPSRIYLLSFILLTGLIFYKTVFSFVKATIKQKWHYYLLFSVLAFLFIVFPDVLNIKYVSGSFYAEHAMLFNKDSGFIDEHLFGRMPYAKPFLLSFPLFFKKLIYAAYNYLTTYSADFLFFNADNHPLNLALGFGFLSIVGVVLIPLGLVATFIHIKEQEYKVLLSAIVCIGVPSILLWTVPDGTHNSSFYVPFSVLAGVGGYFIISVFSRIKVKFIPSILTFLILVSLVINFVMYFNVYHGRYKIVNEHILLPKRDALMQYIKENQYNFNKIFVSPQIWLIEDHILFYAVTDHPDYVEIYQKEKKFPYNIELLMQELYAPNINSDNIRDYYGEKILFIVNSAQLKGHEAESVRIFMYGNGEIFARAYAF